MSEEADVTGRWVGHYTQHDRQQSISADLVQEGSVLTGSMRDDVTRVDGSVSDAVVEAGLPPGSDERIVADLRAMFPDSGSAPVRYFMELPPDSSLGGMIEGRIITFLKTYRGTHTGGYSVGDRKLALQIPDHQVHYRGQVSADGGEIEGRWWIDPLPGVPTRHRNEGTFLLRRDSGRPEEPRPGDPR